MQQSVTDAEGLLTAHERRPLVHLSSGEPVASCFDSLLGATSTLLNLRFGCKGQGEGQSKRKG